MAKMPLGRQKTPVEDRSAAPGWEKLCRPASHSLAVRQIFDQQPASELLKNSQAAQKGPCEAAPDGRQRSKWAFFSGLLAEAGEAGAERLLRDAEGLGGFRLRAFHLLQDHADMGVADLVERRRRALLGGAALAPCRPHLTYEGSVRAGSGRGGEELERQLLLADPVARAEDHEPLDEVAHLAHVPRPVVGEEALLPPRREPLDATTAPPAHARWPARRGGKDVLRPRAERRDGHGCHVEAVVEITAEGRFGDHGLEIAVGRGDDLRVHADLFGSAHAQEALVVEEAQELGLAGERHLADLVEEEGAAVRHLRKPPARADGAREGAALVAAELAFEQALRDGRTAARDEGRVARRAPHVEEPRGQRLSRSAPPRDGGSAHAARRELTDHGAEGFGRLRHPDHLDVAGRAPRLLG